MALEVQGMLERRTEAQHLGAELIAPVVQPHDQAMGLERYGQAHDRALHEAGPFGQLGQGHGPVAPPEGRKHGQDAVGCGNTFNLGL